MIVVRYNSWGYRRCRSPTVTHKFKNTDGVLSNTTGPTPQFYHLKVFHFFAVDL